MSIQDKSFAIIGAMDIEIEEYLRHLENPKRTDRSGFSFYEGILSGKRVIVVKSGVGKVFAAMITQHLIDCYNPGYLIFTGVAGALNPKYNIGDVVVARQCLQHDMDVTAMGFARGAIPFTEYRVFKADEKLKNLALSAVIDHTIHLGNILTGDQFVNTSNLSEYNYLTEELEGDAVEMEGAAAGQVCTVNNIPFLIVRTISDKANEEAAADFENLLPEIANNSFRIVSHILKNYPENTH